MAFIGGLIIVLLAFALGFITACLFCAAACRERQMERLDSERRWKKLMADKDMLDQMGNEILSRFSKLRKP